MRKEYAYHKPSENGQAKIRELRQLFSDLEDRLEVLAPAGRHRNIAETQLQLAAMCCIKAVVCDDPESEVME